MVFIFVIIGLIVAILPGASLLLIPIEILMIYLISNKHKAFEFPQFISICVGIILIGGFLKALATLLHAIPILGQITNSLIAGSFIAIIGYLAEKYYSSKAVR